MVTNLAVSKCSEAQSAYYDGINYALVQLNLPNVAMYIDAGHAGWLVSFKSTFHSALEYHRWGL